MSQEVKVTIEWNGNTVGLHPDPMTVHIAGKADPNEIIRVVAEAMGGKSKSDQHDGGGSVTYVDGGWEPTLPAFHEIADCSGHECGGENTGGFMVADYGDRWERNKT